VTIYGAVEYEVWAFGVRWQSMVARQCSSQLSASAERHQMTSRRRAGTVLAAALIAITAVGCVAHATSPSDPSQSTTTLAVGARGTASGVGIQLIAIDEDSRCPADAVCVWAGNVKARVIVRVGTADTPVTLNTVLQPTTADVSGYRVRIVDVLPLRKSGAAIPPDDYRVTFRVELIS
jgi:hypothetical protein